MTSYVVSAQYAEVAVKGRKRSRYERVLARNLREALEGRFAFAVKHSRLLTYVDDLEVAREVAAVAAKVPGVRWVGVGLSVERDMAARCSTPSSGSLRRSSDLTRPLRSRPRGPTRASP